MVNPGVVKFTTALGALATHFLTSPVCSIRRTFHRRSPGDSTGNPESHWATELGNIEGAPIAARDLAIDPSILRYVASEVFRVVAKLFINWQNEEFVSLNDVELAKAVAFAAFSSKYLGNVTLEALGARVHNILQTSSESDSPLDPIAAVEAIICEGGDAKVITDGMLVLSDTVCMTQECGVTPSGCLSFSAFTANRGDGDGGLLRRELKAVRDIRPSKFKVPL